MKRKLGISFLAALLLVIVSASALASSVYYVTANHANVRSGPGKSYALLAQLPRGTKIVVTNISKGWAKMHLASGSDDGYVSTSLISKKKTSTATPTPKPKKTPTPKPRKTTAPVVQTVTAPPTSYSSFVNANYHVVVNPTNSYVNMRWEASKASQVRRIYYYGAQLKVIAENGTWCQVMDETTGEVGFMLKSFLLTVEEETVAAAENG